MKIAGIIAEYNPFHTGHAWHIAETRRVTGCDYVVACMDGHFTQRGEPAILSKWMRTRMALACGADAVFELPALFAVRTADAFARGGVAILDGLGCDMLSFGSETTDIELMRRIACVLTSEPEAVTRSVRERLDAGMSHAKARGEAIGAYLGVPAEWLNRPNLILGVEYLRSIDCLKSAMEPAAIARRGDYHDAQMGEYASASAIRQAFARGDAAQALRYIPEPARPFARADAMHAPDDMLAYRLRSMSLDALSDLPDVSEGLEHRLYRACREASTREAMLEVLKCKRYTHARLGRLLAHALLELSRGMIEANPAPTYARLLGLRQSARPLLKELKSRAKLPIAASPSEIAEDPIFQFECQATDIWSLMHDDAAERLPGREFTEKFVLMQ